MSRSLVRPRAGAEVVRVDPASAGWRYLGFSVHELGPGEQLELDTTGVETAIVTVSGAGTVAVGGSGFTLARQGVFEAAAALLYVPPGPRALLTAGTGWTVAIGSAPAVGRYPVRLVTTDQVKVEVRGGGSALRQVNHLLAAPLPAERLIVFEVYVPGGAWAGWPPHRHDGSDGSPYLEETYFFRFDRPEGFGFHRNYAGDGVFDEAFVVGDRDCVAVPRGFHVTTAAPGQNMWILNFLAGEPTDDGRAAPPFFDPATTWITERWDDAALGLPVAVSGAER